MNKDNLIKRTKELQFEVPNGATNKEIETLIKVAEHPLLVKDLSHHKKETKDTVDKLVIANEAIVDYEAKLNQADALIEKLKSVSTDASKAESKEEKPKKFKSVKVKVGDDEYKIIRPVVLFKGEKYSAQEASENEELIEAMISSGWNGLVKK